MKFPASFPDDLPALTEAQRKAANDALLRNLGRILGWSLA